jgi:hypothetical protein
MIGCVEITVRSANNGYIIAYKEEDCLTMMIEWICLSLLILP